jgi:hypothetical protein
MNKGIIVMNEEKNVNSSNDQTEDAGQQKVETKTYSEEQFKGLLADKQTEVKKRQELEKQLSELKSSTDNPPSGTRTTGSGQTDEGADDKPLTVSQFKTMMAEERKANAEADFALREKQSTAKAKEKLTAETCGEGLDFETVIGEGEKSLTEGDLLAIKQAKEPAMEKYRRCIMLTPELTERQQALSNAKLLEEIKLTGRVPASGASVPNASTKDVSKMSDEELDKLAEGL